MLGLLGVLHGHLALGGVYVSDFEVFFSYVVVDVQPLVTSNCL